MSSPRTTDLTLYWLPGSLVGLFIASMLYRSFRDGGALSMSIVGGVALVSAAPLLWLARGAVVDRVETARARVALADAREGDDTALGRLIARWSATESDVRAYVDARAWERQIKAHATTALVVIVGGMTMLPRHGRHGGSEELQLNVLGFAIVVGVVVHLWAFLATRAARARAEEAPLAVIVCERGVLFAGDLTWWRGPRRLWAVRSWDSNAIVLESWYALYVPPSDRGNDYFATRRNGPRVHQLSTRLVLPVPEGCEGKADAAVRALRQVHGLGGQTTDV